MNKTKKPEEALRADSQKALLTLLQQVPAIEKALVVSEKVPAAPGKIADWVAEVITAGRRHRLICEITMNGQPRHVRTALLKLRELLPEHHSATPVVVAPYLSPAAQTLCREKDTGFLDLEGNCRLVFDSIFIERSVPTKPATERREFKSVFRPKSAQVLRVLLRDPARPWRVADLSSASGVSLGHVSNVRTALLDREWADVEQDGLVVTRPNALLDAWRAVYAPPAGEHREFYSVLNGADFDKCVRNALPAANRGGRAALASFSAGHRLAPRVHTGTQFLYADEAGLRRLQHDLKLSRSAGGGNVVITIVADEGLFRDSIEAEPGVVCTSPVQTYLDLSAAGAVGNEAAAHLRRERLKWVR